MKPMTDEEIDGLKIWAEKQQQRRPNEILYQDLLRLILTIENLEIQIGTLEHRTDQIDEDRFATVLSGVAGAAARKENEACAEIADEIRKKYLAVYAGSNCPYHTIAEEIRDKIGARLQNSSQSQPESKEAPSPAIGERPGEVRAIPEPNLIWKQQMHPFVGMHPGAPCRVCGLACADPVHDLPTVYIGEADPESLDPLRVTEIRADSDGPPVIARLDKQASSLKSALEAIRDRVSPDQQYLIDELIKGER
jgi:hypothetical protein